MTTNEIVVDNFAGGGGASTGIEMAGPEDPAPTGATRNARADMESAPTEGAENLPGVDDAMLTAREVDLLLGVNGHHLPGNYVTREDRERVAAAYREMEEGMGKNVLMGIEAFTTKEAEA